MFKAICYAYPSSNYARRFKRAAQGCYVIEVSRDYRHDEPHDVRGPFDDLASAIRHADAIQAETSPYCKSLEA